MMLVVALGAICVHVVTQRCPAVGNALREHLDNGCVQRSGLCFGDSACTRVHTGLEARFIGVDVSHPGNGPLTEQLGLDVSPASTQSGIEGLGGKGRVEWLGPQRRQSTFVPVVIGHPNPTEPSNIAVTEDLAVVEVPPRAKVRIVEVSVGKELAGHSEVHDELSIIVQSEQQELPTSAYRLEGGTGNLNSRRELGRLERAGVDDASTHQPRFELTADGLDLGQLGHPVTIPFPP
jgi:hypothetical protein